MMVVSQSSLFLPECLIDAEALQRAAAQVGFNFCLFVC